MRKMMSAIAAMLILCLLSGCTKKLPYEIIREDGACYLIMDEEKTSNSADDSCALDYTLYFETLEEMKNDFETGNFTEKELGNLERFRRDEQGRVKICNLDNLWECMHPSDLNVAWIALCDSVYSFSLTGENMDYIDFTKCSKADFDEAYDRLFKFTKLNEIDNQYMDEERNATVYLYTAPDKTGMKIVIYSITGNGKIYHIKESYCINESNTVPSSVKMLGEDEGRYFIANICEPTMRPSVEWLSQFGIREYVETEVA